MPMTESDLLQLLESAESVVIGSLDPEGFPNCKAMLPPRKRVGLKELYFTTNTSSTRVAQYRERPQACVYFFSQTRFEGLMIVGQTEVLTDQATKDEIWRPGDDLYYPLGVIDPDYCVLKFTGMRIRTYHSFQKDDIVLS